MDAMQTSMNAAYNELKTHVMELRSQYEAHQLYLEQRLALATNKIQEIVDTNEE